VEVDTLMHGNQLETFVRSGGTVVVFAAQVAASKTLQRLSADAGLIVGSKRRVKVSAARAADGSWVLPTSVTPRE
jgi:hypothetical protein